MEHLELTASKTVSLHRAGVPTPQQRTRVAEVARERSKRSLSSPLKQMLALALVRQFECNRYWLCLQIRFNRLLGSNVHSFTTKKSGDSQRNLGELRRAATARLQAEQVTDAARSAFAGAVAMFRPVGANHVRSARLSLFEFPTSDNFFGPAGEFAQFFSDNALFGDRRLLDFSRQNFHLFAAMTTTTQLGFSLTARHDDFS